MSNPEFDLSGSGQSLGGWRLHRLEMANWGTFGEGHVHSLQPECGWTLLVGENGTGKSTAIDAIRTLLAPRTALHHSFNDAAGGQKKKDRTLATYIRGAWGTKRDEEDAQTEIKFLRKEGVPSFLLAVFRNVRHQSTITLAQILCVEDAKEDVVYLVSAGERGIAQHLQGLETGRGLKKELAQRGFEVRESYRAYREDFCARMGIPGEGALEIFNHAIGLKEVTDVSVFLRRNLLAYGDATDFIQEQVIPRFSDLESCWNDIEKAELQIQMLDPVAQAYGEAVLLEDERDKVRHLLERLPAYYLMRHAQVLRAHLDRCALEHSLAKQALETLESNRKMAQDKRDLIKAQYDADETSRLIAKIDLEIAQLKLSASERQRNSEQLAILLRDEELGVLPKNEEAFLEMRLQFKARLLDLVQWQESASVLANEGGLQLQRLRNEITEIKTELESLAGRKALIPSFLQYSRDALCAATNISQEEVPFAGELMEIKPEFAEEWSGAIEKLLYNFGVSLLVPEKYYQQVSRWVNGRRLRSASGEGILLRYHRIPQNEFRDMNAASERLVAGRLNFRDEHPFARWAAGEVQSSFPHACCLDTLELERERFGLTKEGLIRNGTRHVKDDRRAVGAKSDYVLGWSPERKIQALKEQLEEKMEKLPDLTDAEKEARSKASHFQQRRQKIEAAEALGGFAAIDFSSEQTRLIELHSQRQELDESAEKREALKRQLDGAEDVLKKMEKERDGIVTTLNQTKAQSDQFLPALDVLEERVAKNGEQDFTGLADFYIESEDKPLDHLNIGEVRERVAGSFRGKANNITGKINDAERRMIAPMQKFLGIYASEGKNLVADAKYAPEFVALHKQLVDEDLPKHKERFRDFLNTNLTENIGGLEAKLDAEVKAHKERITQVNEALRNLDYGNGTFVEIVRRDTRDMAIRDFKVRLRDCLGSGLNPDEDQRLELYKKIREIVTRFAKEREWMMQVADSRLWLDFSVTERNKTNGAVVDSVDSSTGKSGGQKTRMAFTILAASLLAQYGLADDPNREDSLRLVVVDEVFAKTDAPNSHRALELFQRLGFQLLLAAPWKAEARIAERYVDSFHLTVNPNSDASRIRRATRAQYEAARSPDSQSHG